MNQCGSPMPSTTLSAVMNCLMLRTDVKDSGGRWANVLPLNLEAPSPCHEETLGH